MGLAERKAVQALKDGEFKTFVTQVQQVCGYPLTVDFDWATVENDKDCMWIMEHQKMNGFFFTPVLTALKAICADDMGKSALKDKVKSLTGANMAGDLKFEGNSVRIESSLTGNGAYGAEQIQQFLEKNL